MKKKPKNPEINRKKNEKNCLIEKRIAKIKQTEEILDFDRFLEEIYKKEELPKPKILRRKKRKNPPKKKTGK